MPKVLFLWITLCCALLNHNGIAQEYPTRPIRFVVPFPASGGGDIYFDNVGGEIFDINMFNMKLFGRVVCCGSLAAYDGPRKGAMTLPGLAVVKRLTLKGFIVTDHYDRREEALADLKGWVASGKLKVREDVIDGLENLPQALIGLLAGGNVGKRMVRV